jgi:diadenosine tetraphosphatase ApaH/serine/threonine PP2A family protein phosphatase
MSVDSDLSPDDPSSIRDRIKATPAFLVPEPLVVGILTRLMEILNNENNVLVVSSPVYVCGDIHGQLSDLLYLLGKLDKPGANILFLGDYVDRGLFSLNTFLYLACMKLENPDKVFLLRGNHETRTQTRLYGFYAEVCTFYGGPALWSFIQLAFDLLPLAAVIDQRVFCVHGGISPVVPLVESISLITRRKEVPDEGPMSDLLWSDPIDNGGWGKNARGAGCNFGPAQSNVFCHFNRLSFIARGHQPVLTGYSLQHRDADGDPDNYRVVTIFSAPWYGSRMRNRGAFLAYNCDAEEPRKFFDFDKAAKQSLRPPEQGRLGQLPEYTPDL